MLNRKPLTQYIALRLYRPSSSMKQPLCLLHHTEKTIYVQCTRQLQSILISCSYSLHYAFPHKDIHIHEVASTECLFTPAHRSVDHTNVSALHANTSSVASPDVSGPHPHHTVVSLAQTSLSPRSHTQSLFLTMYMHIYNSP